MQFNYKFYISIYKDLENLSESDALEHYNLHGKQEGRICDIEYLKKKYKDFDYEFYLRNYPDLEVNGIKDEIDCLIHYYFNGESEGRFYSLKQLKDKFPNFDYKFYINLYKDLVNILDEEKAIIHYNNFGLHENRLKNLEELISFKKGIEKIINLQKEQLKGISKLFYNNFFSILTRSNLRQKAFSRNYKSINEQIYDRNKFDHIVSYHNLDTFKYLENFQNIKKIKVDETQIKKSNENPYPYNLYLNNLINSTNDNSWIIFIDDDDLFTNPYCLKGLNYEINTILNKIKHDKFMLFWRVFRCDQLTGQSSFQKSDINLNIALCGFVINSKYKEYLKFTTGKVANVIKEISYNFEIHWSEFIYTKIGQQNTIAGFGEIES